MILRSWSFAPVLGVQHLFKLYLIIGFSSALRERRKAVYAVCAVCAVCAVLPLCLSSRSAAGDPFRIVESRRHNFRRTWSCMVSCAPNSSDNDLDPFSSSFWAFRLLRSNRAARMSSCSGMGECPYTRATKTLGLYYLSCSSSTCGT